MAHSRTAKKAIRQNIKRRAANRAAMSEMRTQLKKVREAAASGDLDTARSELPRAMKLLDKAAKRHHIHANKAARLKSKLSQAVA